MFHPWFVISTGSGHKLSLESIWSSETRMTNNLERWGYKCSIIELLKNYRFNLNWCDNGTTCTNSGEPITRWWKGGSVYVHGNGTRPKQTLSNFHDVKLNPGETRIELKTKITQKENKQDCEQ